MRFLSKRHRSPAIGQIVTRFAPSPTGRLHLGHAFSALNAFELARRSAGRFVLRIEDIDAGRCREEFIRAILEDLAWLGIEYDMPVRRQSQHLADYEAALDRLRELGVVYPCFCTRRDIEAAVGAPQGRNTPPYPGTCKSLAAAEVAMRMAAGPHAWRLDVARASAMTGALNWHDSRQGPVVAVPELLGDVVVARKDAGTSYHIAVVVDDALQRVTDVVRGEDLFSATHVHRLLQSLLGLPTPRYHHHRLIAGPDGKRLAKRDGAETLAALRSRGVGPAEIRRQLGFFRFN